MKKPYTFSGHDTFAVRHGWLKKVHDRTLTLSAEKKAADVLGASDVEKDDIFEPESAMAAFGVRCRLSGRNARLCGSSARLCVASAFRLAVHAIDFAHPPCGNTLGRVQAYIAEWLRGGAAHGVRRRRQLAQGAGPSPRS